MLYIFLFQFMSLNDLFWFKKFIIYTPKAVVGQIFA